MGEKLYVVKREAWKAADLQGVPQSPQPIVNEIQWGPHAGCVMLAFPYRWWHPEDLLEAQVVESTPHGPGGQPFYEAFKAGTEMVSEWGKGGAGVGCSAPKWGITHTTHNGGSHGRLHPHG